LSAKLIAGTYPATGNTLFDRDQNPLLVAVLLEGEVVEEVVEGCMNVVVVRRARAVSLAAAADDNLAGDYSAWPRSELLDQNGAIPDHSAVLAFHSK
jgi:hypothetical protein